MYTLNTLCTLNYCDIFKIVWCLIPFIALSSYIGMELQYIYNIDKNPSKNKERKSNKIHSKIKIGLYYSGCILWYSLLMVLFNQTIKSIQIFSKYNTGTTQIIHNYIALTVIFIILCIIIDILFLRNWIVKTVNIGGNIIDFVDLNELNNDIEIARKTAMNLKVDYENSCRIFLDQHDTIASIPEYISSLKSVDKGSLYVDFLKKI